MPKQKRCSNCDDPMYRLYVGKTELNQNGKRVHKHIPVGWVCIDDGVVEIDTNIREYF